MIGHLGLQEQLNGTPGGYWGWDAAQLALTKAKAARTRLCKEAGVSTWASPAEIEARQQYERLPLLWDYRLKVDRQAIPPVKISNLVPYEMKLRNELGHAVRRDGRDGGKSEKFVPCCSKRGCLRKHNSKQIIRRDGECGRLNCPVKSV